MPQVQITNNPADKTEQLNDLMLDIGDVSLKSIYPNSKFNTVRIYKLSDIYGNSSNYKLSVNTYNALFCDRRNPIVNTEMKVVEHMLNSSPNNSSSDTVEMESKSQLKLLCDNILDNGQNIGFLRNEGTLIVTIDYDLENTIEVIDNTPIDNLDLNKVYLITEITFPGEFLTVEHLLENEANKLVNISLQSIYNIRTASGQSICFPFFYDVSYGKGIEYIKPNPICNFLYINLDKQNIGVNNITYQHLDTNNSFKTNYCFLDKQATPFPEYSNILYPFKSDNKIQLLSVWNYKYLSGTPEFIYNFLNEGDKDVRGWLNLGSSTTGALITYAPSTVKNVTIKNGTTMRLPNASTPNPDFTLNGDIILGNTNFNDKWPTFVTGVDLNPYLGVSERIATTFIDSTVPSQSWNATKASILQFGQIEITLSSASTTTLYQLLLQILGDTYNFRRNFQGCIYDDEGRPNNKIAKLKNEAQGKTANEFITNRIKQWELENPTLLSDDIYKVNFKFILCMLSKYIDCDYVIAGGNSTEMHTWFLKYYADLITVPIQEEKDYFVYPNCVINLKENKIIQYLKSVNNVNLTPLNLQINNNIVGFPIISSLLDEVNIGLEPKLITEDKLDYQKYLMYINLKSLTNNDLPIYKNENIDNLTNFLALFKPNTNKLRTITISGVFLNNINYLNVVFGDNSPEQEPFPGWGASANIFMKIDNRARDEDETISRLNISLF